MILIDNRQSTDPYFNLALEEFLIRRLDCEECDYLLLYINEPSIVLGKNQSIYKEVNFDFLRNGWLKLARRITGGGTVYHDLGNLNFSIITKFHDSKVNNYRYFNVQVIEALGKAGIVAHLDERNNIISQGKKISGSAQFTNRKNIISHGTLLFNADLDVLRACLKKNDFKVESKAVASVNSSVMNISEISSTLASVDDLHEYIGKELGGKGSHKLSDTDLKEVEQLRDEKFVKYEWIYGRSPFTKIEKDGLMIEIEDGLLKSVTGEGQSEFAALTGLPYEFNTIKKALENNPNALQLFTRIF